MANFRRLERMVAFHPERLVGSLFGANRAAYRIAWGNHVMVTSSMASADRGKANPPTTSRIGCARR
jgi:hypothetical protein